MTEQRAAAWTGMLAAAAAGSLFALSFVATPVKFLAPNVPLEHLLAVGRVTFRASLGFECLILTGLILTARGKGRWLVLAAASTLAVQWFLLMPQLDARTLARLAGERTDPSSLHHWWIAMDLVRLSFYLLIVRVALSSPPKTGR